MTRFISCVLVLLSFAIAISGQQRGRASARSEKTVAQYSCPMHSAIKSKSAGTCPKCGMNLVPVKAEKVADAVEPRERSMSIPDVELLDQNGRKVRFYSDLIKGKTVAINFIFTTCTTICPPMGAIFARVQKELENRDAHLISISVDPVTDTPVRLKAWSDKFNAGPGWTLVTGDKQRIDELLEALAAATARPQDHSPTTIIGNDALGQWTRAFGLAKPSQIVDLIDRAANGLLEPATKDAASEEFRRSQECGCEGKPLPDVLATVNGVKITAKDLDPDTLSRILELKQQVVEARKLELDLQINSILLEAEAKKRAVSSSQLLQDEVIKKSQEPTEAEARNVYNEQKGRITDSSAKPAEFEQVKGRIIDHLRAERQQELAKKFADRLRSTSDLKVLVDLATPPVKPSDRRRVFATLNGQQITSGDIEDSLQPFIFSVQEQMYELRRRDLNRKVNDVLLTHEAQKRQVTTRALLESEVSAKVLPVTDAEAQKFYDANKDRMNGAFSDLKEQILLYLQKTETDKLQLAFAANLRKTAAIDDFLEPPEPPIYEIATDDQPAKGDAKAPVTLVEFTDFQCPSCGELQPVLEKLVQEYSGLLRLVVRDYPLSGHVNAFKAAEAAEAAREQGRYWDYTARLFSNQTALTIDKLKQYASDLNLDQAKFNAALDSGKFTDKVQRDLLAGRRVGVRGTPSLFINGRAVSGRSYEALKQAIDSTISARK